MSVDSRIRMNDRSFFSLSMAVAVIGVVEVIVDNSSIGLASFGYMRKKSGTAKQVHKHGIFRELDVYKRQRLTRISRRYLSV